MAIKTVQEGRRPLFFILFEIPLYLPLSKGDAQFPLCKRGIKGDSTALAIMGGGHRG